MTAPSMSAPSITAPSYSSQYQSPIISPGTIPINTGGIVPSLSSLDESNRISVANRLSNMGINVDWQKHSLQQMTDLETRIGISKALGGYGRKRSLATSLSVRLARYSISHRSLEAPEKHGSTCRLENTQPRRNAQHGSWSSLNLVHKQCHKKLRVLSQVNLVRHPTLKQFHCPSLHQSLFHGSPLSSGNHQCAH